jgi:hypothetical protein
LKAYAPSEIARFYEILAQKTHALDTRRHYDALMLSHGVV